MLRTTITRSLLVLGLLLCASPALAYQEIKAEVRYLYVQPGQTLHNIVSKLYPNRSKHWPRIRQEIVRLNPHAFVGGDETRMKADVRLRLPDRQVKRRSKPDKKAPRYVGEVISARGQTLAVNRERVSRNLSVGDRVYVGDKLITGQDGFLRLSMIDKAVLDLRCYSIMVIEEYQLRSTSRKSVLNLLQGSLRKVTGEIGKWTEDIYELRTPIASVGVRGTEYALRVFQSRGCDGTIDTPDDGLYLKVIEGLVDVHNKRTETHTVVARGDTLYVKNPESEAVKHVPVDGVLEPPEKPVVVEEQAQMIVPEDEESSSMWWWLLALLLLAL